MSLRRSVEPTELPVAIEECVAFLNETNQAKRAEIAGYLRAVVRRLDGPEGLLNRALITQTLVYTMNCFPGGGSFESRWYGWGGRPSAFDLPLPPLRSVTSIAYLDENGDTQTFSAASYRVLNANTPMAKGRIELGYDATWPTTRFVEQAVTVTYTAGYGVRNDVPEHIRHLILLLTKEMYDHRDPWADGAIHSPALQSLFSQAQFPGMA